MYEKNSNWFYVLKKLFEKVMSQGYGNEFSMYFSFTQLRMFLTFYFFDIQCFCLFWAQNITMEENPKIERELTKLLANKQTNCPLPSYLLFSTWIAFLSDETSNQLIWLTQIHCMRKFRKSDPSFTLRRDRKEEKKSIKKKL